VRHSCDMRRDKESDMEQIKEGGDLLYGVASIAEHLGITERRALYLKEKGAIPTFRIDKTICARRSTLTAWPADMERRAIES